MRLIFLIFFSIILSAASAAAADYTVDHTSSDLSRIPDQWITRAKQDLHIIYKHTSHGSQLITGMNALKNFPDFGSRYDWSNTSRGDAGSSALRTEPFKIPTLTSAWWEMETAMVMVSPTGHPSTWSTIRTVNSGN